MQARGRLQVKVDESQLEASLVFVPDQGGQVWNKPKLLNLLEEKGIVEGVDELAIEKALGECALASEEAGVQSGESEPGSEDAGAKDSTAAVQEDQLPQGQPAQARKVEKVIARGTPPDPGDPGSFEWGDFAVPEEIADDAQRVLKTAPPPEISRTRTKKEKVKKKVQKKPKLPFGKAKEEEVETTETKSWEEPVNVDPKVLQSGYVEEGQVLAEWTAGEGGKMGKSVYGKPVSSTGQMNEEFLGGRGVKVTKKNVTAEQTGFLRRGNGWAEIIPFRRHQWEVFATKDQATCVLNFTPGDDDATPPSTAQIMGRARELGFPEEELISEQTLSGLINDSLSSSTPLKNVSLSSDHDSHFSVTVTEDKLKGLLYVDKGRGNGRKLVLKEVGAAIKKSGFKNMDLEKIKNDLLEFYRGPARELKDYVLAEGKAPTRGKDRKLEFSCTFVDEEELGRLQSAVPGGEEILEMYPSLGEYPVQSVTKMARVRKDSVVASLTTEERGQDGVDVYGAKIEGLPGSEPLIALYENIQQKGDEFYARENGILDVIEGEAEEETALRVRLHVDSVVYVQLSEDRMKAYLTLTAEEGTGEPLSLEKVNTVLEQEGVKKGINSRLISESIERAKSGQKVEKVTVAEGIPPIDPGESRLKFHVKRASGKALTHKDDGSVDYKNQDRITSVEKDQLIGQIISSDTQPKDGWDVTGRVLQAKEPPPLSIEIGENVRQEEQENGDIRLYARNSGELIHERNRLEVHSVHTVDGNVDMSCGNVKFPGEVQVKGSVHEGFYVMAGGNVKIAGQVESCLISSGETVTVMQGIVGGNKAAIRAKRHIETTFAEQATLLAVGDIRLKSSCLRCSVKCNGTLRLASDSGDLVGGSINTRRGIEAHDIGNEKGARTTISFGQDYLVADQIQQHEKQIKKLREYITKLDGAMSRYERAGERKKLDNVRREKLKYMKMVEKRSMHLFTLRERYEEHFDSSITVHGKIYPGVVLESHGRFQEISAPKERVVFTFNSESGRIEEQPLES